MPFPSGVCIFLEGGGGGNEKKLVKRERGKMMGVLRSKIT